MTTHFERYTTYLGLAGDCIYSRRSMSRVPEVHCKEPHKTLAAWRTMVLVYRYQTAAPQITKPHTAVLVRTKAAGATALLNVLVAATYKPGRA